LATFDVVYVTLGFEIETVTFEFFVEQDPLELVVQVRVVVAPPVTAKVTVTPETGWPFWSATFTSAYDVQEKSPT
jgi:hypothetical protein